MGNIETKDARATPFYSATRMLEYLGRYTHRVAISNNRLVGLKGGRVTFWWRDYSSGNKNKIMALDAQEFIRRFLLHILPDGFVKIRHYGILSNRGKAKLKKCREILGVVQEKADSVVGWEELYLKLTGTDPRVCPQCGRGRMAVREMLRPPYHIAPARSAYRGLNSHSP